jgi:hypothetical protein
MREFQIPCFPVSERTTFAELPDVLKKMMRSLETEMDGSPPLFIFEPRPESRIPGQVVASPGVPEELLVVALYPDVRLACFEALARVEAREEKLPRDGTPKSLKFKENTPLKSFFRQMAELPVTVFSITLPDDGPEAITFFFMRTQFTIDEFRIEMGRSSELGRN